MRKVGADVRTLTNVMQTQNATLDTYRRAIILRCLAAIDLYPTDPTVSRDLSDGSAIRAGYWTGRKDAIRVLTALLEET